MSFHDNLVQSFQNFKTVHVDSLSTSLSEVSSIASLLSTENSTQNSQIGSLSSSTSEIASQLTSMSTSQSEIDSTINSTITSLSSSQSEINSTLNSTLSSLSTSTSELDSEVTVLESEVATKQDTLTAGTGITIVNNVISSSGVGVKLEIVQTLPVSDIDPQTIYLVPKTTSGTSNIYTEYIYINNNWEIIGDTAVDLTNYYTQTQVDNLLQGKEDSLIFDSAPTSGSSNPVTSGGVYTALQNVDIDVDSALDSTSENPVQNKVITSALDDKQDTLIAGQGIEIDEFNIIKSTGAVIYANALFPSGQ